MMFLLDEPYVSDFLIRSIRENNFPVISTDKARNLVSDDSLNWISSEEAVRHFKNNPDAALYTNSENSIAWVTGNLAFTRLPESIRLFKDKAGFRRFIRDLYPEFRFKVIKLNEISGYTPSEEEYPFVIKPAVGFFSIGVHIVRNKTDWEKAREELLPEKLKSIYPGEVIDISDFLIEAYIEGEEYAVDCYFDSEGNAVVLNILHHIFSSGTDTSDRVYSTSEEIFLRYHDSIEAFLNRIGSAAGLKNFPVHVELRVSTDGEINPIEINPMRFGGWCTTADLAAHAYGFNPYEHFIHGKKPDREKAFKAADGKIYSIIILNNNSGYAPENIAKFDYDLLEKDFEHVLELRELDIRDYPVFGFVFTETSPRNREELNQILVSDLKKYIRLKD